MVRLPHKFCSALPKFGNPSFDLLPLGFTLGLLSNDEVIEVNQDPLGQQASRVAQDATAKTEVWAKHMEDGPRAVGLFNRSEQPANVTATWLALQLEGTKTLRDLWRQKNLGIFTNEFTAIVPAHGVALIHLQANQR